ncbi:uncharacterized protein BX664DRAFT_281047 [Halteromyces radiatus]|uniref:uncharacterized protein n=1 Tax=Halteromyces radiatus TaxID=101107 RepID=UPI002221031F|nr:uncharacterized protein BX664DRAFT_281047 [Halteromyces radiatus]KAI8089824.1 hypothetical protein BX664DRAFT_281047 [Halteromyces radiatus]
MDITSLFSVKEKVVLITGGGRGIGTSIITKLFFLTNTRVVHFECFTFILFFLGEMIAQGFVAAGAKVYISSRNGDVCNKVAKELTAKGPGQCFAIPGDLQKLDDIKKIVEELSKLEDHLDVLINNSGANWGESINTYPSAAFEKVMNLNVNRLFTLTQACLPLLRAKATNDNPSRVINIGSINGLQPPGLETYAYSSSKAAVHHLSRHLASRLGSEHILVNAIAPGSFPSKMMAETLRKNKKKILAGIPLHRVGTPEDIAGTCLYLASRAGQYTTGAIITVDGGATVNNSRL